MDGWTTSSLSSPVVRNGQVQLFRTNESLAWVLFGRVGLWKEFVRVCVEIGIQVRFGMCECRENKADL